MVYVQVDFAVSSCIIPNCYCHLLHISLVFLDERYYVTFALWYEPSVCRLSVVCDVRAPAHKVKLFVNIFAAPNRLGTWTVCFKILNRKSMGSR